MTEPLVPSKADAVASPRAIGGHRLFDRLDAREVGTFHLAHKDGSDPVLMWWADVGALPEIAATWNDVVRALRAIQSPNVPPVRGSGEQGPLRWMTFTYVPGETLAWVLKRMHASKAAVPWEIACRMIADAARAVDALHACRDGARAPWPLHGALSGETFTVTYDGRTLLLDPGRLFPLQSASHEALAYSAPERVWSEPSDARADVFSLGVLLWELCAGRRLFLGRDEDETRALLEAHVVPDLASRVRGAPARLDAIVGRALARLPGERTATAGELAKEIESLFEVGGATIAEVAKYMRSTFADRDRAHRQRLEAAAEPTEIRLPSGNPMPEGIAPRLSPEDATVTTHDVSGTGPTPAVVAPPKLGETGSGAVTVPNDKVVTEERTRPRIDVTGETKRVSFDAQTKQHATPFEEGESKTLPRIRDIESQISVVLEPEELLSVSEVTQHPPTRRRSEDEENTTTNLETPVRMTPGPAPLPPRPDDFTPTRIRAETRPRRGGMEVSRPLPSAPPPAAGRPPTPAEPFRNSPLPPPPRPPRRNSDSPMRAAEPAFVRAPPPAPPPPRPPPRNTPPPPQAYVASPPPPHQPPQPQPQPMNVPHPATAPLYVQPAYSPSPVPPPYGQPGGGFPAPMPPGMRGPAPGAMPGMMGAPVQAPMSAAMQAQMQMQMQMQAQAQMRAQMQAQMQQAQMQQAQMQAPMAAPAPPYEATSDSSVSFGPSPPAASTVLNEPAEKVIVAEGGANGAALAAAAAQPEAAAPPVNGLPVPLEASPQRAHPSPLPPAPAVPASGRGEPLLLPRDPNMPAMQRALLAREAVRESDRRIALPVVVVAFVVAIGIAIGIPLLARRPPRIVTVPPATAEPSAQPSVVPPPLPPSLTLGAAPPVATGPLGVAPSTVAPPTGPIVPALPGTTAPPLGNVPVVPPSALPESHVDPRPPIARTPPRTSPTPRPRPRPEASPTPRPRPQPERDDEGPIPTPKPEPVAKEPSRDRESSSSSSSSSAGSGKGQLTVICNPACDDVVDGTRSLGPSPVFKATVTAGQHRLTLRISDPPQEKVVTVTVSPDEITVLTQAMTK